MEIIKDKEELQKIIMVGDRLLIKPRSPQDKTKSGLFLPPGVHQNEKIYSGYIVKVGPGYPVPFPSEESEVWESKEENTKYIPLQAREGDLAVYVQQNHYSFKINNEDYIILSHSSVLMLIRDDELFK